MAARLTDFVALVAVFVGCSGLREVPEAARTVADGPERWLLTSEERGELGNLRSRAEVEVWREMFWARRNPDPEGEANVRRELFLRRVEDADRIYGVGDLRGALTARGRALILLGPPSVLRRGQRPAPRWARPGDDAAVARTVPAEEWVYPPQRLPAGVVEGLAARGETELLLRFVEEPGGGYRLVQGEAELRVAAAAWLTTASVSVPMRGRDGRDRARAPSLVPRR